MPRENQRQKYDHWWEWSVDDANIENWYIQQGPEYAAKHGPSLFTDYKALFRLYWPEDDEHRWEDAILHAILDNDFTSLMGPASCVVGSTRILDAQTGEEPTIEELFESRKAPCVMTLNGPAKAEVPFLKGTADVFRVTLTDGSEFTATGNTGF